MNATIVAPRSFAGERRRLSVFALFGAGLIVYFAASSMYVFPRGLPQPADYLLLAVSALLLLHKPVLEPRFRLAAQACTLFIVYAFVVSAVWTIATSSPELLRSPAYYGFNALAFAAMHVFASRAPEAAATLVKRAVAVAVISLTAQYVLHFDSTLRRQSLGFENPNQLAYYALCLCGMLLVLRRHAILGLKGFAVLYAACSLPLITTFSAAALAAWAFSLLIVLLTELKRSVWAFVASAALLSMAAAVLYQLSGDGGYLAENVSYRAERLYDKTADVAVQRGYSRILEFPRHIAFGAAEGARWRFGHENAHELHSTIGTLVFSYGLPGTALFVLFVYACLRGGGVFHYAVLGLPLLYSVTHQGLRTTMFWLLLAVISIFLAFARRPEVGLRDEG